MLQESVMLPDSRCSIQYQGKLRADEPGYEDATFYWIERKDFFPYLGRGIWREGKGKWVTRESHAIPSNYLTFPTLTAAITFVVEEYDLA